jgi:hypothetical protein
MDNNTITGDHLLALLSGYFVLVLVVGVFIWFLFAAVACMVAPDDRPWSFFWCTLLFLGPLGIALALIAPARPIDDDDD